MSVYLAYSGMQNMFLTESPDFTHFKTIYTRDIASTSKVVEHPFDKTFYTTGDTLIATLKQNGDYMTGVSLKVILPSIVMQTTQYWVYQDSLKFVGNTMTMFNSSGSKIFDITVNGLLATTKNLNWLTVFSDAYVPGSTYVTVNSNNKFSFSGGVSYVIFSDIAFANFFGFINNPIQLLGGYVRFNNSTQSQITFQESGWLTGDQIYNQTYSYLDDTIYKLVNSVGLYIGKQLVQEFDSETIKLYKEITYSYKNRPTLKLLEGNDSIVNGDRIYYVEVPFITLPVHAIPRHDVQIRLKINPLNGPYTINFYVSLVLSYDTFSVKLPSDYTIKVPQVSYFTDQNLDMKGPVTKIIVKSGDPKFSLSLNGELFIDEVNTKTSAFENLTNIPMSSNTVFVLNNPINMSRIRDQLFSSNSLSYGVYSESLNVLKIKNEMFGLGYGFTDASNYPNVTSALTNPQSTSNVYLFDQIPKTVSGMLCFYSMRVVSFSYSGAVVRLRNENTDIEYDFYSDTTQSFLETSNGISVSDFLPARVVKWYDQSLNKNDLTQVIKVAQPSVVLDLDSQKYVVAILNDTNNSDVIKASYWMDISNPIHPQQFAMTMKLNSVGTYSEPISIFSSPNSDFRLIFGDLRGGSQSSDWYNLPNGGTTYFTVNGYYSNYISTMNWYNVTSWKTSVYTGSDMNLIGTGGNPYFQTPQRSTNGYFFEIGFMKQSTLSSESTDYYDNRPPL